MDNVGTIILMAVFVIMSAFFSATETAFNSLSITKIKIMAEKGKKSAALVLKLLDNYDKLLSTILVGNNVVNIALASVSTVWFVGLIGNSDALLNVDCTV